MPGKMLVYGVGKAWVTLARHPSLALRLCTHSSGTIAALSLHRRATMSLARHLSLVCCLSSIVDHTTANCARESPNLMSTSLTPRSAANWSGCLASSPRCFRKGCISESETLTRGKAGHSWSELEITKQTIKQSKYATFCFKFEKTTEMNDPSH